MADDSRSLTQEVTDEEQNEILADIIGEVEEITEDN